MFTSIAVTQCCRALAVYVHASVPCAHPLLFVFVALLLSLPLQSQGGQLTQEAVRPNKEISNFSLSSSPCMQGRPEAPRECCDDCILICFVSVGNLTGHFKGGNFYFGLWCKRTQPIVIDLGSSAHRGRSLRARSKLSLPPETCPWGASVLLQYSWMPRDNTSQLLSGR